MASMRRWCTTAWTARGTPGNRDTTDAQLARRLGLCGGRDAPVFLSIGGIEERKNTLRILQAFLALRADHGQAQLVIAGGASLLDHDAYTREFQTLAAAHGLQAGPGRGGNWC